MDIKTQPQRVEPAVTTIHLPKEEAIEAVTWYAKQRGEHVPTGSKGIWVEDYRADSDWHLVLRITHGKEEPSDEAAM
jgi:hypothetical protein